MNNKVALYLRVSSEEQARIQDGSLVSQRKRLEEYVEGQNRRDENWGRDRLETTPVENRRPFYSNLIQFAELHPTRIRVGIIAPAQLKATATDGMAGRRMGSTSVTFGAPREP